MAFVKEDNAEVFFCGSLKYSDSNERVFFFFVCIEIKMETVTPSRLEKHLRQVCGNY